MTKKTKSEQPLQAVEVVCPACRQTQIVYFPKENMPICPKCRKEMVVKEILTEGKYG